MRSTFPQQSLTPQIVGGLPIIVFQMSLSPEILSDLAAILAANGLTMGCIYVTTIAREPLLCRIAWDQPGEPLVSVPVKQAALTDAKGLKNAAETFLKAWKRRKSASRKKISDSPDGGRFVPRSPKPEGADGVVE